MARNSADVVDHEVDAKLSAGDHESDEAKALAAINASWFDDSERTDVLEPRHLVAQLAPQPTAAAPPRASESGQRPIPLSPGLSSRAAEDPRWNAEHEESYATAVDRLGAWAEPDSGEWEDAQTAYFERTANFELLDAKFVREYTDRLPGGLAELVSSDAERPIAERSKSERKSGVRKSASVLPNASLLDEAESARAAQDREQSVHFAYEVSPSARAVAKRSAPSFSAPAQSPAPANAVRSPRSAIANTSAAERRVGSETIRNRSRAAPVRADSIPSDPIESDPDALEFDEASVATARGGRRFVPTLETTSQRAATLQRKAAAMEASLRPPRRTSPRPSVRAASMPAQPEQPAALAMSAGLDSDIAELREQRREHVAAWIWLGASALAGVALILVVRAWTNGSLAMVETPQEPSVAVETTVNAAHEVETGFTVTSQPEGAQIYVDGKPTGFLTPARVRRLTPGLHSVELKLGGYYDTSVPAVLHENATLELAPVEMRAHPAVAEPVVAAAPVGGIVPQLVAAPVRSHPRRGETRRWLRRGITRNAPTRGLNGESGPTAVADGAGTLRINSRPWARVMIDNKFVGNTPQRGLRVASGEHNIKLVNEPLSMSKTFHVTIHDGETVTRVEMLNEDAEQSRASRTAARDALAKADR